MKKTLSLLILLVSLVFLSRNTAVLASEIDDCKDASCFQGLIDKYSSKINETQAKKKTLADEISVADNKIFVTNVKIAADEAIIREKNLQIASVSGKIDSLALSLDKTSIILAHRIQSTYITGRSDPIVYLFGSASFAEFINRFEILRITQKNDKKLMENMAFSQKNYKDQKDVLAEKKKQAEQAKAQLESDKTALAQLKAAKQVLLEDTKNSEAEYQRLVSVARARLSAFSAFATSLGGGTLSNQTTCDQGWTGCYYNQRDSQWAGYYLPGSKITLATAGCLATDLSMVLSHYGYKQYNPGALVTVSNSYDLFSYGDLRFSFTISGGPRVERTTHSRWVQSLIDSELNDGRPVIIGINFPSISGMHFITLISGSNGNYKMNDPYREKGFNINFSDYYSTSAVLYTDTVRVN